MIEQLSIFNSLRNKVMKCMELLSQMAWKPVSKCGLTVAKFHVAFWKYATRKKPEFSDCLLYVYLDQLGHFEIISLNECWLDNFSYTLPKYCGSATPKPAYISNWYEVLIWFRTDHSNVFRGVCQYSFNQDGMTLYPSYACTAFKKG